jgi:oxygen-independent coproporphyrinogen-3 oxidase
LAALDRIHSAAEAKESYRWAREAGFRRINLDLIYGLPSFDSLRAAQDARGMERWQSTLDQAIELAPEHLSLYALTVEEGTKLAYDVGHGRVPAPDPDLQAAMYEWTLERLAATPYRQYEISNWALQGEECRHNLVYWRNGEWLGLGAGAHSHLKEDGRWKVEDGLAFRFADVQLEEEGRWKPALSRVEGSRVEGMEDGLAFRFADAYSPRRYIGAVRETAEEGIDPGAPLGDLLRAMRQVTFVDPQPPALQMADTAILALRLNEGLDTRDFERRFGEPPERVFGPALTGALSLGLLEAENGRLRLTPRGRLLANEVFVRLLPDQG